MISRRINGINVFGPKSFDEILKYIENKKTILIAANAEKLMSSTNEMKKLYNNHVVYPDGIGAVWALMVKGVKHAQKIPGVELWLRIINEFYSKKTFYLIGAKTDTIKEVVCKLKSEFFLINILNYRDGYIQSKKELENLIIDIKLKKPDIVFVAMGSPKQEKLMEMLFQSHPAIYLGLGGSFDVYTGNVLRAPKWFVQNNLEWAYRLIKQPKRIKRQIVFIPFLWKLILNKL